MMCGKAFELFDTDKSGLLSQEELREALLSLELKPTEIEKTVLMLDESGNGYVDYLVSSSL